MENTQTPAATIEPVTTEVTAAPETPKVDPRLEQLSKKEAALFKEREAFKKQQAEVTERLKQIDSVNTQVKEFERLKQTNKLDALKYLGFTETEIFEALAGAPDPTPEQKTQKLVNDELEKFKKSQEDAASLKQAAADKRTIDQYKQQINDAIKSGSEKYEFLAYNQEVAKDIVFNTIEAEFKGRVKSDPFAKPMAMSEAMDIVESYYENEAKEMSQKINKLKSKPSEEEPRAEATSPLRPSVNPNPGATESREQKRTRLITMLKQTGLKRS